MNWVNNLHLNITIGQHRKNRGNKLPTSARKTIPASQDCNGGAGIPRCVSYDNLVACQHPLFGKYPTRHHQFSHALHSPDYPKYNELHYAS